MPEYARICVNMPKSTWMAFVLHFPCGYSLKKNEAVFLKKQDLIFSIAAGSILFGFLE